MLISGMKSIDLTVHQSSAHTDSPCPVFHSDVLLLMLYQLFATGLDNPRAGGPNWSRPRSSCKSASSAADLS